ncbi:M20 metallopeptidase family protein [Dethiobacter alkaliphilus]|uniref:M20 metallopeptidase family protein n=1 Tax=Dethiobacter alkaliphilus TaxID=427926 RepID=UPI0022267DBF|nr:amidohydrolase [Dethiobacter alkaliphilus]MCW3491316.1 amidohydrolase [Dethiobacter alkaliphilus]
MNLHVRLSETRRRLHAVAETGFALDKTRNLISQLLVQEGLVPVERAGGIVTESGEGKNCILLRADMDALPVRDGKDVAYKSVHEDCCHACGHDAHMAMVYGSSLLMKEEELGGRVRYMFQPAEECPPGGALGMIESGVLDGVDMAFAMHVAPWLPFGAVGIKENIVMAAADNFKVTVRGRSGHGAMPHEAVDAVLVASHVVTGLQALASRMANPLEPLVVTVGKVRGGTAANVIADEVILEGTVRTLSTELQGKLPGWIERTAQGICDGFGAECETEYRPGYPVLKNWNSGLDVVTEAAGKVVGDKIVRMEKPLMGGEDFAYVLERVPGAFLFLGTGDEQYSYPLHHPCFDFNEEVLSVGAELLREITKVALGRL